MDVTPICFYQNDLPFRKAPKYGQFRCAASSLFKHLFEVIKVIRKETPKVEFFD